MYLACSDSARALPKFIGLAALLSILASGCGTTTLQVRPDPADATVVLTEKAGTTTSKVGPARFELNGKERYEITVSKEGFEPRKQVIDSAALSRLVRAPENHDVRVLDVKLEPATFSLVEQLMVEWKQKQGVVGVRRSVRAFKDTNDTVGRPAKQVLELPAGHGVRGLTISPDGSQIVFSEAVAVDDGRAVSAAARRKQGGESAARPAENHIVRLKACNLKGHAMTGGGIAQITNENFKDVDPCFTPDGKHLLFASNRRRPERADILQIQSIANAGGVQDIRVDPGDSTILKPTIGSDGTIVFVVHPNGSSEERTWIWTMSGPHNYPTQLTSGSQPQISPDGKRIAFIGDSGDLYVIQSDGTAKTQLTFKAEKIRADYDAALAKDEQPIDPDAIVYPYSFPSWSPDGKSIVYCSMESSDSTGRPNEDICVIGADGTGSQQLTSNGSVDTFPVFMPDGKSIVFLSNRGERWAIWSIEAPVAAR